MRTKKKMHSSKKKILIATSMMFLFSITTSITATFAWFTLSSAFSIQHLNINFQTKTPALYLGIRGEDGNPVFKDEYTAEEVGIGYDGLVPVSGMFQEDWLSDTSVPDSEKMPKFCNSFRPGFPKTKTPYAEDGFLQKEFFFKANDDCSLYLSDETFFIPNEEKNKESEQIYGLDINQLNGVVNAIRVSFYMDEVDNYVIMNPGEKEDTYYGGLLDLNLDGYYDYESGKEIAYGQSINSDVVFKDEQLETSVPLENNKNTFFGNHKDHVDLVDLNKTQFVKEKSRQLDECILYSDEGNSNNIPLCLLHKDEIKRVVVSIYLEGWDYQTYDGLEHACLDASLIFAALFNRPFD